MNETIGRLLAVGNVAEVFEWGSRVVKLYKSTAAKPTAFREAAIHAAVETMGLPVPKVWSVQEIGVGVGGTALHAPKPTLPGLDRKVRLGLDASIAV